MDTIVEFFKTHIIVMALVASAAWFYAGYDYLRKGNPVGAVLWEIIAVLILIAFCVSVVLSSTGSWLSFAVAIVAISVELWLMRRGLSRDPGQEPSLSEIDSRLDDGA
jgi:hypothetical protein